jgi:hypothetical protein
MFVNKLPFFITLSRKIKSGTVKSISNRQVTTTHQCLQRVVDLYMGRGLIARSILANGEFELL